MERRRQLATTPSFDSTENGVSDRPSGQRLPIVAVQFPTISEQGRSFGDIRALGCRSAMERRRQLATNPSFDSTGDGVSDRPQRAASADRVPSPEVIRERGAFSPHTTNMNICIEIHGHPTAMRERVVPLERWRVSRGSTTCVQQPEGSPSGSVGIEIH
jgi:hypothetical protein